MSVYFNQEMMQFYLHTKHTSYVMELYENHLAHSYWGSRVKGNTKTQVVKTQHFKTKIKHKCKKTPVSLTDTG